MNNQKFIDACGLEDIEVIKKYLNEGVNINAISEKRGGLTALSEAIDAGNTEIAKLLIEKGADINGRSKYGSTPLMRATFRGNINIAKYLINKGADVNAADKNGGTALIEAVQYGFFPLVKLIVKNGANVNLLTKGECPTSPLHEAASKIANPMVEYSTKPKERSISKIRIIFHLFLNGGKIRAKDWMDTTPLYSAISDKHFLLFLPLLTLWLFSFLIPSQYKTNIVDPCPTCGEKMSIRQQTKNITKRINDSQSIQQGVVVSEKYCPNCDYIENSDLYNDMDKAREEMQYL